MITFLDDRDKKDINDKIDDIQLKEGASAYEVAVENGFEGSEEAWLQSLHGQDGKDGKDGYTPVKDVDYFDGKNGKDGKDGQNGKSAYQYAQEGGFTGTEEEFMELLANPSKEQGSQVKIGEVTLLAASWVGDTNLYSQVVNINGVTENSQVDLTPNVEQLAIFYEKDLAFVTENENGVVTVYAIGQKPQNDYTIQVTITEVNYE